MIGPRDTGDRRREVYFPEIRRSVVYGLGVPEAEIVRWSSLMGGVLDELGYATLAAAPPAVQVALGAYLDMVYDADSFLERYGRVVAESGDESVWEPIGYLIAEVHLATLAELRVLAPPAALEGVPPLAEPTAEQRELIVSTFMKIYLAGMPHERVLPLRNDGVTGRFGPAAEGEIR